MIVLITGVAGFIGFHVAKRLLHQGISVVGIDNLNNYYDPSLKEARLKKLTPSKFFRFFRCDIENYESIKEIFNDCRPDQVINLAAQAGVRYSIENPNAYIQANLVGFSNILEASKNHDVSHFVYASSSSVYGGNTLMPFSESHPVDHPVSLYAATKKANELMAHTYSHLFKLPTSGLRFFTVYGPWGRPDMALFLFTKAIVAGTPIDVYNNGNMMRDFTYIDDIVESIIRLLPKPPTANISFDTSHPDSSSSWAPYQVFNIGNSSPVPLMDYIDALELSLGKKAIKKFLPIQPGDVPATSADTEKLSNWIDFRPSTKIEYGVSKFVSWYRDFYGLC